MTAQAPDQVAPLGPMFVKDGPKPGTDEWMRWFQNLGCGEPFEKHVLATDFSLQMAISLQNYRSWKNEGEKISANGYKSTNSPARIKEKTQPAPRDTGRASKFWNYG